MLAWPSTEFVLGALLISGLFAYVLSAGADFGAGIWTLLAGGPRREAHRKLISDTIGPLWEANHVWLIFVLVILFTAFPVAFELIMTWLAAPFFVLLLAIVLRGAAFVFDHYDPSPEPMDSFWRLIFGIASIAAPFCLGSIVGAIVSGRIGATYGFIGSWLAPFPACVGLLTVVLFAHLAAVYLVREASAPAGADVQLMRELRLRAFLTSATLGAIAIGTAWLAQSSAPHVARAAVPLIVLGAVVAAFRVGSLLKGKAGLARLLAGAEVPLIFAGWIQAQYPYAIFRVLTFDQAAAPRSTQVALIWTVATGTTIIVPGFLLLFRMFDRAKLAGNTHQSEECS